MKGMFLTVVIAALLLGCGGGKQVTRLDPNTQTDLSLPPLAD
jgi:hypothetical protein